MSRSAEELINYTKDKGDHSITFGDFSLSVFKNVFPPIHPDSILLAECNDVKEGEIVLEIGSGTGIQSLVSAKRKAKKVVAIDIQHEAVINTRFNADKHGFSNIIEARHGDLFDHVNDNERFDLILVNLPFEDHIVEKPFDIGIYDPNYATHKRFIYNCRKHLVQDGRILLAFSSLGDIQWLESQLTLNDFKFKVIRETDRLGYKWRIYYIES